MTNTLINVPGSLAWAGLENYLNNAESQRLP
jgi:hypothetical protein